MVRNNNYFDQYENLFTGKGSIPGALVWVVGRVLCIHPPEKNRHGLAVESYDVWLEKEDLRDSFIELEALAPMQKVADMHVTKKRIKAIYKVRNERFKRGFQMRKLGAIPGCKKFSKLKKEAEPLILERNKVKVTDEEKFWLKEGGVYKDHYLAEKRKRKHLDTPEDYAEALAVVGQEEALKYMVLGGYHANSLEELEEITDSLKGYMRKREKEAQKLVDAVEEKEREEKEKAKAIEDAELRKVAEAEYIARKEAQAEEEKAKKEAEASSPLPAPPPGGKKRRVKSTAKGAAVGAAAPGPPPPRPPAAGKGPPAAGKGKGSSGGGKGGKGGAKGGGAKGHQGSVSTGGTLANLEREAPPKKKEDQGLASTGDTLANLEREAPPKKKAYQGSVSNGGTLANLEREAPPKKKNMYQGSVSNGGTLANLEREAAAKKIKELEHLKELERQMEKETAEKEKENEKRLKQQQQKELEAQQAMRFREQEEEKEVMLREQQEHTEQLEREERERKQREEREASEQEAAALQQDMDELASPMTATEVVRPKMFQAFLQNFKSLDMPEYLELICDHCGVLALNAKTGEEQDMWWWAEVVSCNMSLDIDRLDLEIVDLGVLCLEVLSPSSCAKMYRTLRPWMYKPQLVDIIQPGPSCPSKVTLTVDYFGVQLRDGEEEFDFWTWDEVKLLKVVTPPPSEDAPAKVLKVLPQNRGIFLFSPIVEGSRHLDTLEAMWTDFRSMKRYATVIAEKFVTPGGLLA
jgi:hypothetical protein